MGKGKSILKKLIPPIILDIINSFNFNRTRQVDAWSGSYKSWVEIQPFVTGYDDMSILNKTKDALLQVKSGAFAFERDSVLFEKPELSWSLIACLQKIIIETEIKLSVLDFGGSLGSTYFQNKWFLPQNIEWSVVEQVHVVTCGQNNFEDNDIKFYQTIEHCKLERNPSVLLLGSVLPYMEDPTKWIEQFLKYEFPYIIIDRTSFSDAPVNRLTLQTVSSEIYAATYPCWFFNEEQILSLFKQKYQLVSEVQNTANPISFYNENGYKMYWKGFFLKFK